jgi:hypothetical protein
MSKFNNLLTQIELFIKKYYKNQMVKGVVLFLSFFLFSFLLVSSLEYFGRFGNLMRSVLFYTFIVINIGILINYILIPLFKLTKLSKRLSLSEASVMIGSIFPDISDKLVNTLQLNQQLDINGENVDLLNASIEQRSMSLSIIPFTTGINLNENRKYLKFLLPVIFVLILIAAIKPTILSDGSERIVNYNTTYVQVAPFEFNLISPVNVVQGENYKLEIKLTGTDIPKEVKIYSNLGTYNLKKISNVLYVYEFSTVNESINFTCESNGFSSNQYTVDILQKGSIDNMTLNFIYPKHTQLKDETITNIGDMSVPEGTIINWKLKAENTTKLNTIFADSNFVLYPNSLGNYSFTKQLFASENYGLSLSSKDIEYGDTLNHSITVVKDIYPSITITDSQDSLNKFKHFIEGIITDDYGFKSLVVYVSIIRNGKTLKQKESLKFSTKLTKQFFYHQMDYASYNLSPGDKLEYSFTVTDNDNINNFKSSTSIRKTFSVPSLDSLDNMLSEQTENIKKGMDKAKSDSKDLKDQLKNIKNKLLNKQSPDWKDKQNLENLMQQQENLQKQMEKLNNEFNDTKEEEDQFLNNSEELEKKQEELQKLMDDLMDDEMKALMEELQKLMDEMNKGDLIEKLEDIEKKTETLEEELDRTLELFKNMEIDKKLESIENQLKELSKEQDELKKLTDDKKLSNKELAKKQDDINKKFDEIQKDLKETETKNKELDTPRDLEFSKELEDGIEKETKDSKENLDGGKSKKSSKAQEKASEMMKKMADDVGEMKSKEQAEQDEEDMDAMRFLLENIVNLSHQQENLMNQYKETKSNDPYYLSLNRSQLKIQHSTVIVKDSLIALSKRVSQLSSYINEEISDLNYNLDKSLVLSEERITSKLTQHQQYSITAYNNLALMLSEVLDAMQNQAKSKMQGKGSCSKPGGSGSGAGKPKPMDMESMKKAMKKQIAKMKGGNSPGGKDGKKPGKGGEGGTKPGGTKGGASGIPGLSSKEIAKMAFEQGQMRNGLQKMRQEMNKDGSGNGNMLNDLIKDMEEMQNDLLNQNLDKNLLSRQQDIMTRFLESEKAMQERGFSDKRESKSSLNENKSNQIDLLQYTKKKNAEIELLKSVPVGLRVYYKNLINEYFNSVNN